jgi:hypothetical protein
VIIKGYIFYSKIKELFCQCCHILSVKTCPLYICYIPIRASLSLHVSHLTCTPSNQKIFSMDFTAIWFCRGCDLGKVQDEKHLLLVCPNTHKVREHFCLALPLTHMSTLTKLMQIRNTVVALVKFVACC